MKTETEGHSEIPLDLNVEEGAGAKECKDVALDAKMANSRILSQVPG